MSSSNNTAAPFLDDLLSVINHEDAAYQPSYKNAVLVFALNGDASYRLARFLNGGTWEASDSAWNASDNAWNSSDSEGQIIQPQRFSGDSQDIYACPEFEPLKKVPDQMTNAHFLRKVIRDAKLVKFVITANYNTLSNSNSTLALLNNIANFFHDLEQYKDSIVLVVQDVAEHDAAVRKIINHLNVIKHNDNVPKNVQNLIDILVSEQHITTLPKANIAGDDTRVQLTDFIDKRTFHLANDLDFQYVFNYEISDEAKRLVEMVVHRIGNSITENISEVVKHVKQFIIQEVDSNYSDLYKLHQMLVEQYEELSTVEWQKSRTVRQFSEDLTKLSNLVAEDAQIRRVLKNAFQDIYNLAVIESYLQTSAAPTSLTDLFSQVMHKLYDIVIDVKVELLNWRYWVEYAQKINAHLIKYADNDMVELIKNKNSDKYFKRLRNDGFKTERIHDMDDLKYKMLYDMTKFRLEKKNVEHKCIGDVYRIESYHAYISNLIYPKCQGSQIEFFAFDTVTFNMGVRLAKNFKQITIIAPKWVIHHHYKEITMTGEDGRENYIWPKEGTKGRAGLPGRPSPNFFGIGDDFTNIQALHVVQVSGNGAKGQHGYPGGPGGLPGKKGFFLILPMGKSEGTKIINDFKPGKEGYDRTPPPGSKYYGKEVSVPETPEDPPIPEIGAILERYRNLLRQRIHEPFQSTRFDKFLAETHNSSRLMDEYANFEKYYSRQYGNERYRNEFIQVFDNLEMQYINNVNREYFPLFYQLFLQNILKFREVFKNNAEERQFYEFLYSTVFTKFVAVQNRDNSNLIIDFNGYMKMIMDNINKQKALRQIVSVNNAQKVYEKSLNAKIDEAMTFTAEINKGIDSAVTSIEGQIKKFINEVDNVTEKLRKHRDTLVAEEEKMKRNILFNRIFGILKVITKVVSVLGPIGSVVGGIADSALGITESALKEDEIDTALPDNLKNVGKQVDSICNTVLDEKTKVFKDEVKTLKKELKEIENEKLDEADAEEEAKELAEELERTASGLDNPDQSSNERNALQRKLKKQLRDKEAELEKREKKNKDVLKKLKRFNDAVSVAEESFNVYKTWKGDDKKLSEIGKKIKETEKNIKDMEVYREKVEKTVGPMLDQLRTDFKQIDLSGKSQVALDVKRWDVKGRLTDLKIYMRQLLLAIDNTAGIKEDIASYVDKLEDTMNTMINIYDRIEALRERKVLVKYIAHVNTAQSQFEHISNEHLRDQLERLNLNVQEGIVLWQYQSYMDQFKQWVFPFAQRYLQEMNPSDDSTELITRENKQDVFKKYAQNIETLKGKLEMYKNVIVNEHDSQLFFSLFSTKYLSTRPFYVWNKERHANVINKLLEGQEVFLSADINASHANKFGLKFNIIGLEFTTEDPEEQRTLSYIMKNVKISMTHTGNSYYRCDDEVYMITNEPQTLVYSYETYEQSMDPVSANDVYKKLKTGDLILSPYTMWKVRLESEYNQEEVLRQLEQFKGKVNVALKGKGHYTTNINVCNQMDRYEANKVTNQEVKKPMLNMQPFALDNETDYMVDDILDKYQTFKQVQVEPTMQHKSTTPESVTPTVVNSVSQTMFNWFYDKWNSTSPSAPVNPSVDVNSSLLLLDVMYKRFTNKKFEPIAVRRETPLLALQAEAIKLTAGLEKVIDTMVLYSEGLEHFDPIATQKELLRLLRTSDATTINNYMIDTVQQSVPLVSIAEIKQELEKGQLLA